jgi:Galactosyltransferase
VGILFCAHAFKIARESAVTFPLALLLFLSTMDADAHPPANRLAYALSLRYLFLGLLLAAALLADVLVPGALPSPAPARSTLGPGISLQRRPDLRVLYLPRDTAVGAARRAALRAASLSLINRSVYSVGHSFLVTPHANSDGLGSAALRSENATYGDIELASGETVMDRDLTSKILMAMRAVVALAGNLQPTWWLKGDDDLFVRYDLLLPALSALPKERLMWCRKGRGGLMPDGLQEPYCNGMYLFSTDVLSLVLDHGVASICQYNEDICISGTASRLGIPLIDDVRWHNDDRGNPQQCLCKPWTTRSDSLMVHHVKPELVMAYHTNKTLFSSLFFPFRPYRDCPKQADGSDAISNRICR